MLISILAATALAAATPAGAQPDASTTEPELTRKDLVAVRQPTVDDVTRVYPGPALGKKMGGAATVHCTILADGALSDCAVSDETSPGWGFGDAAVRLATRFRFEPIGKDGRSVVGRRMLLPIRFAPPFVPTAPP